MKKHFLYIISLFLVTTLLAQESYKELAQKKFGSVSCSFSRDGKLMAGGYDNGMVLLWDVEGRVVLKEMGQQDDYVLSTAFSPDGYYVAAGSRDATINLYNVNTGLVDKRFTGHQDAVTCLVFSPDGNFLYSAGADHIISIWDVAKNMKISELRGHTAEVSGLDISPDASTLVSSSYDGSIKIWDLNLNSVKYELNLRGGKVRAVAFSPDGTTVAAASDDKSIRLVDIESKSVGLFLRGHRDDVYKVKFTPHGHYVISTSLDGVVKIWSTETGVVAKELNLKKSQPVDLSVNSQGKFICISYLFESNILWDVSSLKIKPAKLPPLLVHSEAKVPDSQGHSSYTKPEKTKLIINKNKPRVTVVQPTVERDKPFIHEEKEILVKGTIKAENGLFDFTINGVEVPVIDGKFEHKVKLAIGYNTIKFKAVDVFNNIQKKHIAVERRFKLVSTSKTEVVEVLGRKGTDYALIIATDDYDSWNDLSNPIFDGKAINDELKNTFGFQTEVLKNPTRTEIYSTLRKYNKKQFSDDDQLFIFIAGHGEYDDVFQEGYIVAKDSKSNDDIKESYISHSNLRTIINNIPCNHVLLAMDVCFGGTFDPFVASGTKGISAITIDNERERFIERKLKYDTRKYLTSGGKEYVPDGRPGHHSPFANKVIEALRSKGGDDGILTFGEFFSYIERVTPAPTSGGFGKNQPGSDFLFIAPK